MANNPLDLKEFKHYLDFKSDSTGRIQISEPVKWDGAEFVIEQDKMYARDVSYMSEEMDLEFYKGFFEESDEQYQLPNGIIVDRLGHAIEYLFEYNKDYGYQSQIEYILERNGVEFIVGELNFEGAKTDELTYFNCKVVQNTNRALSKRRDNTKLNGFADKDLDDNDITPLTTYNMLLKAKPVVQESEWIGTTGLFSVRNISSGINSAYYNNITSVIKSGIEDDLSFFPGVDAPFNMGYVEALNRLSNIDITLDVNLTFARNLGNTGGATLKMQYFIGNESDFQFDGLNQVIGATTIFQTSINNDEVSEIVETFSLEGLEMEETKRLYIWFYIRVSSSGVFGAEAIMDSSQKINITATSTAIDTVVKAVRYGDLLRYSLKAVNGMDIIAPDLDVDGKYYDLMAFSGNLIRQRDDVPFYFYLKDRRDSFQNLTNGDLQINETEAFAIGYDKYYDNVDNGGFLTVPDDEFEMTYNKKYAVNLLEYKFKSYEKDRDESNTLDAVHTEAQFSINNTRVNNTKKIDVGDVFDPFAIESIRRQQFKETTSLEGDDKIHCMDVVNLPPTEIGGFTSNMTHNIDEDGRVQLLKDPDLPSWALLGFEIGSLFNIDSNDNNGEYTVDVIENTIITLIPNGFTPTFTGEIPTTVSYPFSNVQFVNRTNEGFDEIQNLLNPDNFGNLRYTIRRNLIEWESYISTCASYIDENPKNTEFKNNGLLVTQYEEGETYTENGDIDLDTIQPAILSPRIYNIDVIVGYDDVLDLIKKYEAIDTVGGFIRVQGNNGDIKRLYPQKLAYTWSTSVLSLTGEQRVDSDVITINKIGDIIYIDEVAYSQDQLFDAFYEANEEFFTIYDENKIKIINFTKYNKFIVQEETFDNPTDLAQALIDL